MSRTSPPLSPSSASAVRARSVELEFTTTSASAVAGPAVAMGRSPLPAVAAGGATEGRAGAGVSTSGPCGSGAVSACRGVAAGPREGAVAEVPGGGEIGGRSAVPAGDVRGLVVKLGRTSAPFGPAEQAVSVAGRTSPRASASGLWTRMRRRSREIADAAAAAVLRPVVGTRHSQGIAAAFGLATWSCCAVTGARRSPPSRRRRGGHPVEGSGKCGFRSTRPYC